MAIIRPDNSGNMVAWANWKAPEALPNQFGGHGELPLYQNMSRMLDMFGNLTNLPETELFLGSNAATGQPERMDMAPHRNLILNDPHNIGQNILKTIVMGIKGRPNQSDHPITVISHKNHQWHDIANQLGLAVVPAWDLPLVSSVLNHATSHNGHFLPHIIVFENLGDLNQVKPGGKEVVDAVTKVLKTGHKENNLFVIATAKSQSRLHWNSQVGSWIDLPNKLYGEITAKNTLEVDNTNIWVPDPQ